MAAMAMPHPSSCTRGRSPDQSASTAPYSAPPAPPGRNTAKNKGELPWALWLLGKNMGKN